MTEQASPTPQHEEAVMAEPNATTPEVTTETTSLQMSEAATTDMPGVPEEAPQEADGHHRRKGIAAIAATAVLAALVGGALYVGKSSSESTPKAGKQPAATGPARPGHKQHAQPTKKPSKTPSVTTYSLTIDPNVLTNIPAYDPSVVNQTQADRDEVARTIASALKPTDFYPLVNTAAAKKLEKKYPTYAQDTPDRPGIESYANANDSLAHFMFNTPGNIWAEPTAVNNTLANEARAYNDSLTFYDQSSPDLIGSLPVITKADVDQAAKSGDATELFKKMLSAEHGLTQVPYAQVYINEIKAGNPDKGDVLAKHLIAFGDRNVPADTQTSANDKALLSMYHTIRKIVQAHPHVDDYAPLLQKKNIFLDPLLEVAHADVIGSSAVDPEDPITVNPVHSKTEVTLVSFAVQMKFPASTSNISTPLPMLYTVALVKAPLSDKDPSASQAIVLSTEQLAP